MNKYEYQLKFFPNLRGEYEALVSGLQPSLAREIKKIGGKIEVVPFLGKKITIQTPLSIEADKSHLMRIGMNRNLFFSKDSYITKIKLK